jgi:aspartate/methionine/tyrosine aminotransferase
MKELRARKQALEESLMGLKMSVPQGAFYCFIDFNDYIPVNVDPDKYLMDLLIENGIAAVPGSAFGKGYEGFIRLSFSTLDATLVEEGAKRLRSVVTKN